MWVQVSGVDLGRDASLRLELLQIWCVLENFVSTVWAREAGIVRAACFLFGFVLLSCFDESMKSKPPSSTLEPEPEILLKTTH